MGPFLTALRHPEMPASWLSASWHLDPGVRAPLPSKAAALFLLGLCGRPHTRPFEFQGSVLAKAGVFREEERTTEGWHFPSRPNARLSLLSIITFSQLHLEGLNGTI